MICFQTSNVENLAPNVIRRVTKELIELVTQPLEGIKVILNDEDISDIQAIIEGPSNGNFNNQIDFLSNSNLFF